MRFRLGLRLCVEFAPQHAGAFLVLPQRRLRASLSEVEAHEHPAADESDRLVRLARIAAFAEETHGNPVRASRWRAPNSALAASVAPIHWLDTDVGAKEVEELLIRIAHGVYR
jgi:putative toxin-antitoxin system antitoxin component (TIGR02293 family)